MSETIPFLDLVTPHRKLREELTAVFRETIETGRFIGGPLVEEFERGFARFCDANHCAGVASGTDAVRFALVAAGVRPGDVVLTVPNTFIATTEAITQAGAIPEFIDINEKTYNLDTDLLSAYLESLCNQDRETGRPVSKRNGAPISAVVPVHLYGQPAAMDDILSIAEKYNLRVIEDACQAHGAEYYSNRTDEWKKTGSLGHAAAFSFYPGKNLGAMGEGGAVTTGDSEIHRRVCMLRDHGQAKKYIHEIEGYNGRLDAIQAGILGVKLRLLTQWNEQRRRAAFRYNELFESVSDLIVPFEPEWAKSVYHLYVIRVRNRDEVQKKLADRNIGTALHYPVPLHLQKAYKHLGYQKGDFTVTEKVAAEILSLPMFPGLTDQQMNRIMSTMKILNPS